MIRWCTLGGCILGSPILGAPTFRFKYHIWRHTLPICLVFVSMSSIDSRNPVAFSPDSMAQVESVETIRLRVVRRQVPLFMCACAYIA